MDNNTRIWYEQELDRRQNTINWLTDTLHNTNIWAEDYIKQLKANNQPSADFQQHLDNIQAELDKIKAQAKA